jgi:hypothetical protein
VLSEFAPRLAVVSEAVCETEVDRREWTLAELFPEPFEDVPPTRG